MKVSKLGFFVGEYRHNLTQKNRVALPKRIRVEIDGTEIILSKGFGLYIVGFDRPRWQKMVSQQLETPFSQEEGRRLRRKIFSTAMPAELDRQGRIVLPEPLLKWAKLKGKVGEQVVVAGVGDHFEIWETKEWNKNVSKEL